MLLCMSNHFIELTPNTDCLDLVPKVHYTTVVITTSEIKGCKLFYSLEQGE